MNLFQRYSGSVRIVAAWLVTLVVGFAPAAAWAADWVCQVPEECAFKLGGALLGEPPIVTADVDVTPFPGIADGGPAVQTRYVDNNPGSGCRDNNNTGLNPAVPFCHIKNAVEALNGAAFLIQPGDKIAIKCGTYLEDPFTTKTEGTQQQPIRLTYWSYPPCGSAADPLDPSKMVIVKPRSQVINARALFTIRYSNWYVDGIAFDMNGVAGAAIEIDADPGYIGNNAIEHTRIRHNIIQNGDSSSPGNGCNKNPLLDASAGISVRATDPSSVAEVGMDDNTVRDMRAADPLCPASTGSGFGIVGEGKFSNLSMTNNRILGAIDRGVWLVGPPFDYSEGEPLSENVLLVNNQIDVTNGRMNYDAGAVYLENIKGVNAHATNCPTEASTMAFPGAHELQPVQLFRGLNFGFSLAGVREMTLENSVVESSAALLLTSEWDITFEVPLVATYTNKNRDLIIRKNLFRMCEEAKCLQLNGSGHNTYQLYASNVDFYNNTLMLDGAAVEFYGENIDVWNNVFDDMDMDEPSYFHYRNQGGDPAADPPVPPVRIAVDYNFYAMTVNMFDPLRFDAYASPYEDDPTCPPLLGSGCHRFASSYFWGGSEVYGPNGDLYVEPSSREQEIYFAAPTGQEEWHVLDATDHPIWSIVDHGVNETASACPYEGDGIDPGWMESDCVADVDGDGHTKVSCGGGDDCNDYEDTIHPGAIEACWNGVDDDCDGSIDEGCPS